jgi:hypothetical protein
VPHGQFYRHLNDFHKIKIRTAELHHTGKKPLWVLILD